MKNGGWYALCRSTMYRTNSMAQMTRCDSPRSTRSAPWPVPNSTGSTKKGGYSVPSPRSVRSAGVGGSSTSTKDRDWSREHKERKRSASAESNSSIDSRSHRRYVKNLKLKCSIFLLRFALSHNAPFVKCPTDIVTEVERTLTKKVKFQGRQGGHTIVSVVTKTAQGGVTLVLSLRIVIIIVTATGISIGTAVAADMKWLILRFNGVKPRESSRVLILPAVAYNKLP